MNHPLRGFSLMEVLLVLVLLGMAMVFALTQSESIFAGLGDRPIDELLRVTVREARYQAAHTKEPVVMSWNEESAAFEIALPGQEPLVVHESGFDPESDPPEVTFLLVVPERGAEVHVHDPEYAETAQVVFHPDRTSHPFAVKVVIGAEENIYRFDPFSDAELIIEESW